MNSTQLESVHRIHPRSASPGLGSALCHRVPSLRVWGACHTSRDSLREIAPRTRSYDAHLPAVLRETVDRWWESSTAARPISGRELEPNHARQKSATLLAACCLAIQLGLGLATPALAVIAASDPNVDNFENVPAELSSTGEVAAVPLSSVVSGPKKREIEGCTRKCVPTCIRGGEGAPGLGPISVRKEIVVFKEGFRSRQYCLSECAQVCALSLDKDKAAQLAPAR